MKSFIVLFLLITFQSFPQFILHWEKSWSSSGFNNEELDLMITDYDGNIIAAGSTYHTSISYMNVSLAKFSPGGELIWNKLYDLGWSDEPIGLYTNSNRDIFMGVRGADVSIYNPSFVYAKYDKDGNKLFGNNFTYYLGGDNIAGSSNQFYRDHYGYYYIGGVESKVAWRIKMTDQGTRIDSSASIISSDPAVNIRSNAHTGFLDPSTQELFTGATTRNSNVSPATEALSIVKIDNSGQFAWKTNLLTHAADNLSSYVQKIIKTSDGNLLIISKLYAETIPSTDTTTVFLTKLDPGGTIVWQRKFPKPNALHNHDIHDIRLDAGGQIVITGTLNNQFALMKLSQANEIQWSIQDPTLFSGDVLMTDADYNIYCGAMDTLGRSYLVRYTRTGQELFRYAFPIAGVSPYFPFYIAKILPLGGGNYLIGGSRPVSGKQAFYIAKITDPTTSIETSTIPSSFRLLQNYPNPFNPETTIRYQIPEQSDVFITVHTLLGEEVLSIKKNNVPAGEHQQPFQGNELPSGIYFCTVKSASIQKGNIQQSTIKMVLMR